jgi:hypothetical protein
MHTPTIDRPLARRGKRLFFHFLLLPLPLLWLLLPLSRLRLCHRANGRGRAVQHNLEPCMIHTKRKIDDNQPRGAIGYTLQTMFNNMTTHNIPRLLAAIKPSAAPVHAQAR